VGGGVRHRAPVFSAPQHPGAQHGALGFVARMNALRNLPSTWGRWRRRRYGFGEEVASVLDVVGAGGLEGDFVEAGGGDLGAVVVLIEGAGNAADPEEHAWRTASGTGRW